MNFQRGRSQEEPEINLISLIDVLFCLILFLVLTTSFNLHFTKPLRAGTVIAEGRWVTGKRRVFVAEARLVDEEGDEIGRGTGTFMRSRIALSVGLLLLTLLIKARVCVLASLLAGKSAIAHSCTLTPASRKRLA